VGSQLENELILVHVLMALLEALNGARRTSNPAPTPALSLPPPLLLLLPLPVSRRAEDLA
jgi:hypothetical protein